MKKKTLAVLASAVIAAVFATSVEAKPLFRAPAPATSTLP